MEDITLEGLNREGYKYYAFISYNHRDEKFAKALQSKLRRFRLPSVARTEVGADIRIDPIFRYRTNLPVAQLREQIKDELERSKYLIVVCSRNSAKPNIRGEHWVNDEVLRFIQLGRIDRIIPVIVDGVPNSGDDRECFCPALRENEISAVNLRDGGPWSLERKHEFLRLVAKLLSLDPAELIKEADEDDRRDRIKKFFCWLPLILLILGGAIFAWDALRSVENYYADYVDSYGLPKGIFPLAKSELHRRHIYYRFEYSGIRFGKSIHTDSSDWSFINLFGCQRVLRRVVQSNSANQPRTYERAMYLERPPILEFELYTDDILRQIVYRGTTGVFQRRLILSDGEGVVNGIIELKGEKSSQAVMDSTSVTSGGIMRDSMAGNIGSASEIAQYQLKRDKLGREIERRFKDVMGYKFVADSEGVYGFSYKLDSVGRIEEHWYLDVNGDRHENKQGVAGRKYHYVGRNMDRVEYVNFSGMPVFGPFGWMVCIDEFNEFDNNIRSCFYNANGKRMICKDGFAELRREYDARGNVTSVRCYGVDGKPCLHKDGFAELRREYDARGNETSVQCYGVDGKPCLHNDGYAELRGEYDARGNVTSVQYYGVDGKTCLHKDGVAEGRLEYDARGNKTSVRCYGVDGKPCLHKDGFAELCKEYDARGNVTSVRCYGVDGKPCLHKDGFAELRLEYDARGNETLMRCYDTDGKPCLDKDGVAEWHKEYDARGNVTSVRCYGVEGKPCLSTDGYAELRLEYDARGNVTSVQRYDADGKPCL